MKKLTKRAEGLKFKPRAAAKINRRKTNGRKINGRTAPTIPKRRPKWVISLERRLDRNPEFQRLLREDREGKAKWHRYKSLAQLRRELGIKE